MSKRYPDLIVENYVESANGNMLDLKVEFEELPDGNLETEEVAAEEWKKLYLAGAKIA